ncbi:MAG: hypothetical protein WCG83_02765 [Candidatus Peregrinibacteria bacterium]
MDLVAFGTLIAVFVADVVWNGYQLYLGSEVLSLGALISRIIGYGGVFSGLWLIRTSDSEADAFHGKDLIGVGLVIIGTLSLWSGTPQAWKEILSPQKGNEVADCPTIWIKEEGDNLLIEVVEVPQRGGENPNRLIIATEAAIPNPFVKMNLTTPMNTKGRIFAQWGTDPTKSLNSRSSKF